MGQATTRRRSVRESYRDSRDLTASAEIRNGRAPLEDITFAVAVGPLVEGDVIAARWTSRGRYQGGLPGATAAAGAPGAYSGMDLFLVENGQITESWVNADVCHLMAQLGVVAS